MSKWKCFICGKAKKFMRLKACGEIPRHIISFDVSDFNLHILTTVCLDCLKDARNDNEHKPRTKKQRIPTSRPEFVPTVENIPLPSTGKKYCLGCLYLPGDLLCKVKKEGMLSEVHITNQACDEYIEKVF